MFVRSLCRSRESLIVYNRFLVRLHVYMSITTISVFRGALAERRDVTVTARQLSFNWIQRSDGGNEVICFGLFR